MLRCLLALVLGLAVVPSSLVAQQSAYEAFDLGGLYDPATRELDVELFDRVLNQLAPRAQNYPPRFASKAELEQARRDAAAMGAAVEAWTQRADGEPEVAVDRLLRAGRLWAIGHNLDVEGAAGRALAAYERAVAAAPDHGELRFHFGAFLGSTDRYRSRSIEQLEKAVELGYARARWGLALALVMAGETAQALAHLEAYGKEFPEDPNTARMVEAIREGRVGRREAPGPEAQAPEQPLSLVALTSAAMSLTAERVERAAVRAFGEGVEGRTQVRENRALVRLESFALMVVSEAEPVVADVDGFADSIDELRLREAVRGHRAALRVLASPGDGPRADKLRAASRLLAELADEIALALSFSDSQRLFVFSDSTRERLRAAQPIRAMMEPEAPEVLAPEDEAEMAAAVDKARATLAEFRKYLAAGVDSCSIKIEFVEGDHKEHMWVTVRELGEHGGTGTLANDPVWITKTRLGDPVEFTVEQIEDWICVVDDERKGGFTVDVFTRQQERKRK